MSMKRVLLACAFAPLTLGVAFADDLKLTPVTAAPPAATVKSDERTPDLTALRYYAKTHELARVAAEIRRIRNEFPNFNPPDDLYSNPKPTVDEQPLWDLYAKGDFAGVDAKLVEMKQQHPEWTPTRDFVAKYTHAKAAKAIVAKSDAKQWGDVVTLATAQDGLVNCSEFDLAWRIGEAFAKTGDQDKAFAVYKFLLTSCTSQAERLATGQKAVAALDDPAKVQAIIDLGHRKADGTNEFADLAWNKLRTELGTYAVGTPTTGTPTTGATTTGTTTTGTPTTGTTTTGTTTTGTTTTGTTTETPTTAIDAARLDPFERAAKANKNGADALLLGWYYRKLGDHEKALDWMRIAYEDARSEKSAEGLMYALRETGKVDDAEALSYEWRDKAPLFRNTYIDIVSTSLTSHGAKPEARIADLWAPDTTTKTATLLDASSLPPGDAKPIARTTCYRRGPDPVIPLTPAEIERLAKFKVEVEIAKSALGAQSMGWRIYDADEVATAEYWFERSMTWKENEPAALGVAVSAKRLGQLGLYRAIYAKYASVYPSIAELERKTRLCEGRAAYETTTHYYRAHRHAHHYYRPRVTAERRYPGLIGD